MVWRELMAVAGLVETAVGGCVCWEEPSVSRADSLLFMGSGLLLYRGCIEMRGRRGLLSVLERFSFPLVS